MIASCRALSHEEVGGSVQSGWTCLKNNYPYILGIAGLTGGL